MVTSSYRLSFFSEQKVGIATVRAGNVIGGGDWASDRLVPDCLKAFESQHPVTLRHPYAVRPWQHVLESLSGYLCLSEKLVLDPQLGTAWNFGPDPQETATVQEIAQTLKNLWGADADVSLSPSDHYHEAGILRLDNSRARYELGWIPRWTIKKALAATVDWYRAWLAGKDMMAYSLGQIQEYQEGEP
jgi:CDP-glucose 4,6-dehydratase